MPFGVIVSLPVLSGKKVVLLQPLNLEINICLFNFFARPEFDTLCFS